MKRKTKRLTVRRKVKSRKKREKSQSGGESVVAKEYEDAGAILESPENEKKKNAGAFLKSMFRIWLLR